MNWVLLIVAMTANGWQVAEDGRFDDINDCFWAREYIIDQANQALNRWDTTTPPPGMQAICVRIPTNNT